jgi:hypothetical protein
VIFIKKKKRKENYKLLSFFFFSIIKNKKIIFSFLDFSIGNINFVSGLEISIDVNSIGFFIKAEIKSFINRVTIFGDLLIGFFETFCNKVVRLHRAYREISMILSNFKRV